MGFQRKDGRFVRKKKKEHLDLIKEMRRKENHVVLPGRRIVDVDVMASAMRCESCEESLTLDMITDEQRHGLGSFFLFHVPMYACHQSCFWKNAQVQAERSTRF